MIKMKKWNKRTKRIAIIVGIVAVLVLVAVLLKSINAISFFIIFKFSADCIVSGVVDW